MSGEGGCGVRGRGRQVGKPGREAGGRPFFVVT